MIRNNDSWNASPSKIGWALRVEAAAPLRTGLLTGVMIFIPGDDDRRMTLRRPHRGGLNLRCQLPDHPITTSDAADIVIRAAIVRYIRPGQSVHVVALVGHDMGVVWNLPPGEVLEQLVEADDLGRQIWICLDRFEIQKTVVLCRVELVGLAGHRVVRVRKIDSQRAGGGDAFVIALPSEITLAQLIDEAALGHS